MCMYVCVYKFVCMFTCMWTNAHASVCGNQKLTMSVFLNQSPTYLEPSSFTEYGALEFFLAGWPVSSGNPTPVFWDYRILSLDVAFLRECWGSINWAIFLIPVKEQPLACDSKQSSCLVLWHLMFSEAPSILASDH